jgi:hypothetical protein
MTRRAGPIAVVCAVLLSFVLSSGTAMGALPRRPNSRLAVWIVPTATQGEITAIHQGLRQIQGLTCTYVSQKRNYAIARKLLKPREFLSISGWQEIPSAYACHTSSAATAGRVLRDFVTRPGVRAVLPLRPGTPLYSIAG